MKTVPAILLVVVGLVVLVPLVKLLLGLLGFMINLATSLLYLAVLAAAIIFVVGLVRRLLLRT